MPRAAQRSASGRKSGIPMFTTHTALMWWAFMSSRQRSTQAHFSTPLRWAMPWTRSHGQYTPKGKA
ncbi:MAG: hypothetical protein HPY69_15375 [Armatimonadetes bacterium]|nr:hypothetical protein [Armatimonadota bacterium]